MIGASTVSWLSDEEKSIGNSLTAGSLDLKVDLVSSTHYRWDGTLFEDPLSFDEKDLGEGDVFFCWNDLKPGDYGEFTLSLHLYDNPGDVIFTVVPTADKDNGFTEPEDMVDGVMDDYDGTPTGDLDDYVFFYGWIDCGETPEWDGDPYEGDNILLIDYEPLITWGHLSDISPNGETWDLSELIGTMEPCVTYYIAIAWFIPGEDMAQGDFDPFGNPILYDLPGAGNIIQGDTWVVDFTFSVEHVIGIAMTMIGASTVSWLSDEEKSIGNSLTAGSLDLKVDLVNSTHYRWNGTLMKYIRFDEKDLTGEDKLFDFSDVKPGDYGEFTLSLHLYNNPGYLFFNISNIFDDDNGINDPEDMVDGVLDNHDGTSDGDLDDYIFCYIWIDWGLTPEWQGMYDPSTGAGDVGEGDNYCDCGGPSGEPFIIDGYLSDIEEDSYNLSYIMWKAAQIQGYDIPKYMEPCKTYYIAIAWFIPGETLNPGEQDPFGRKYTFPIPGAGNIIQTDTWSADILFYVEQMH